MRGALADLNQTDRSTADNTLLAIIDAAQFGQLETSEQHAVLAAAAERALALRHAQRAHELAVRATAMAEQSVVDWEIRARAADVLDDTADALLCINQLAGRWRGALKELPDTLIVYTGTQAARLHLNEPLRVMLQALYAIRWRDSDGTEPSALWVELTRILLEQGDRDAAADVASHITSPYFLIGIHADNRYKWVLKSQFVHADVRQAAAADVDAHTRAMQAAPRSLRRVVTLATTLRHVRRANDALILTTETLKHLDTTTPAAAGYDDAGRELPWIMDARAEALAELGRYDEAVAQLQQAIAASAHTDHVSHEINLAGLLCELGRAAEIVQVLPGDDTLSAYGRMQRAKVRVMAATQLGRAQDVEEALTYLRENERDAPDALQSALLWAGQIDEASQLLISRLQDPALRTDALREMQQYSDPPAPPRRQEWRERLKTLRERPEVRATIQQVGSIDRYALTRLGG
jgi:tetratricopeptide (TPR) repeat protein